MEQAPARYPIVGLGGSAGALAAFFDFFDGLRQLGESPGMAFVVVLHLAPDDDSALVDLLGKHTRLPVRGVTDTVDLAPDTVYVIPPDKTPVAGDNALAVRARSRNGENYPVDDLFFALADVFGDRATAIVCSGTGSNGAAGIAKVREAGGCVMAQAPETAEFDDMPRRAIRTGFVDLVLPPREMGERLAKHAQRLRASAPEGVAEGGRERTQAPRAAAVFRRRTRSRASWPCCGPVRGSTFATTSPARSNVGSSAGPICTT